MKKLLLALALTLSASSSMSAEFITVHTDYNSVTQEVIMNVDNIYTIEDWNSSTDYPSAKTLITFNFGSGQNNLMPHTYVSETKEQIKAWLNMKN